MLSCPACFIQFALILSLIEINPTSPFVFVTGFGECTVLLAVVALQELSDGVELLLELFEAFSHHIPHIFTHSIYVVGLRHPN